MAVSMEYLYQDIKGYEVTLIAGHNGLKNKVRWTHIVENEEIALFLQGLEVVFITGIAIKDNKELLNLIIKTKQKNASAVIINIGKYITDLDDEIITFCNESDYPLFVVPWNIRMIDVMRIMTVKMIESEKVYSEISNAIKDAIFLSAPVDSYIPILKKIGFHENWRYIVTTIEVEGRYEEIDNIESYVDKVKLTIEEELSYMRHNFFAVDSGQSIIVIFYNKSDNEIHDILKKLYVSIDKRYHKLRFYVGIGIHNNTLKKLDKGYEEARDVAKINRLIRNDDLSIRYSEVAIYRLLLSISNKEIIKEFSNETIGDLEIYDELNGSDYVELLIKYFENNCRVNETAKKLYIHRNTVNYKISKIEEILDLNLSDIGDKSKIYLSLMIRNLI